MKIQPVQSWRDKSIWLVPSLALFALVSIYLTHANQSLFLKLNHLSALTGDALWANITILGDALVASVLVLCFAGRRPDIVCSIFIGGLLAATIVPGIKELLDVPRPPSILSPELFHIIGPAHKTDAFPSGHTTTAFVLAGVLSLHLRYAKWPVPLLVLGACAVGLSRIVVGVHWPYDTCAGAIIGWLCAVAGVRLACRWPWGQRCLFQIVLAVILAAAAAYLLLSYRSGYPQASWLEKSIALTSLVLGASGFCRLAGQCRRSSAP